jgi:hypothetical protein
VRGAQAAASKAATEAAADAAPGASRLMLLETPRLAALFVVTFVVLGVFAIATGGQRTHRTCIREPAPAHMCPTAVSDWARDHGCDLED